MGQLRIIAGKLKGRRLKVPSHGEIRPTPERVREALFSILSDRLEGARVLDAFSGSGALGFEALSRGAGEVTFIESDPATARRLESGARELELATTVRVVSGDAQLQLTTAAAGRAFDLVLADPPYADPTAANFLQAMERDLILASAGLLVLERDARSEPLEPEMGVLRLLDSRRYGGTRLDFYAVTTSTGTPS